MGMGMGMGIGTVQSLDTREGRVLPIHSGSETAASTVKVSVVLICMSGTGK